MNVKELRVGNWYKWYADGRYYFFKVDRENFALEDGTLANFEPIDITPEILIESGFIKFENCLKNYQKYAQYDKDRVSIILDSDWENSWTISCEYFEGDCPKYLHQLQNLLGAYGIEFEFKVTK